MKTTSIISRTPTHLVVAAMAIASSVAIGNGAVAQTDLPDWDQCVYRDLPIAASVGGILPVNMGPPPETRAALRGEVAVGTDCSIYDLPV